ncbi:MAG: hypothetical protein ACRD4R_08905 [Candidatus Acidiferrales bacterium]
MLFDTPQKEQRGSKIRRYVIMIVIFVVLVIGASWYMLRYYKQKDTVRHFLNEVAAGNMQEAYKIWKPSSSYSFKDFLEDWGSNGYYGPVRSYHIERTVRRNDSNGVDVIVEVSPYKPFPSDGDAAEQSGTKEIDLGVRFSDESISFPPPAL